MTVVCVTGMHRSGTSLLARAVNLLGVGLGPDRHLLPPTDDNPSGYWEDNRIVQLDDQLLGFLDGWWHQPPPLVRDWQYDWRLEPFRVWAAQLVADRQGDVGPVGFKDPRLSLLLPFWRTVVDVDRSVISARDPREVARSLATRDAFDPEWSAYLWLRYTASAIVNDPTALVVRHDDWFGDLDGTAELVAAHLGLAAPTAAQTEAIAVHCDPSLRRSQPDDRPMPPLLQRAEALYTRLASGSVAGVVDEAARVLDALTPPTGAGPG